MSSTCVLLGSLENEAFQRKLKGFFVKLQSKVIWIGFTNPDLILLSCFNY